MALSRRIALTAAVCLAALAGGAQAAGKTDNSAAAAQYKRDLADCDSGRTNEDRNTCRTEAQRAYAQAKAGDLPSGSADQLAQNARQRCDALKGIDRTACLERANGKGTTSGSVGGGGILRESTVTVPAK